MRENAEINTILKVVLGVDIIRVFPKLQIWFIKEAEGVLPMITLVQNASINFPINPFTYN